MKLGSCAPTKTERHIRLRRLSFEPAASEGF
jgi:hypothetical protein